MSETHSVKFAKLKSEHVPCSESPLGYCASGTITEEGGILNGTTKGLMLEVKYHGSPLIPSSVAWKEDAAIITDMGTIKLYEEGTVSLLEEEWKFQSSLKVVGGTKRYSNATGELTLRGTFTDPTHFQAEVNGVVQYASSEEPVATV